MPRVELDRESARRSPPGTKPPLDRTREPTHATVFGLDVRADSHLPFLDGAVAAATGRTLEMSLADACEPPAGAWPDDGELLCDQREPDGTVGFRIEAHAHAGYRIWGPAHGTHLLDPDGLRLASFPSDGHQGMGWQRLLIAQALPFAATLRGLEVFHAGAALLDGAAIAFAGASRSGKTSAVTEMCRVGASFMADDVLALERVDDELLVHPGTPLAGVDREAEPPSGSDRSPREVVAADARELMVRMPGSAHAAPLEALFFIDRRADGPRRPRFEPLDDARTLLSATFNFVLVSPDRLRRLLDVCALAAKRRVERVVLGPGADPSVVVAAALERMSARR
jgi:hypothetical protein